MVLGLCLFSMICFSGVPDSKRSIPISSSLSVLSRIGSIAIDSGLIQSATCWALEVDAAHEAGGGMHKEVMIYKLTDKDDVRGSAREKRRLI